MAWQYTRRNALAWERFWRRPVLALEPWRDPWDLERTRRENRAESLPPRSLDDCITESPFVDPTARNVRRMMRFLGSRMAQDRLYAIAHLNRMGRAAAAEVPAAVPALIRSLRCEGLGDGQMGRNRTVPTGIWVRAGIALSRMEDLAVPGIVEMIQREWREERDTNWGWTTTQLALIQGIQALAQIGRGGASERIDSGMRSQASSQLSRVMESLLSDPEPNNVSISLVVVTIQALGEFGDSGIAPLLQNVLERWRNASSLVGSVSDNVTRSLLRITTRIGQR